MRYKHILVRFKKVGKRFKEYERIDMGIATDRNVELATSKDTMKFFKGLGAKEKIQYLDDAIIISSISPSGEEKSQHIFEYLGE